MPHRILVVDDDPHIRQVLVFALGRAGMEVAEAADGEEALDSIAGLRPDLVVLDIGMPRLDGLEVCRRLRASPATEALPILFLSSRTDEVDRVVGIEIGGDDYVVKPFSPREVVARIGAILKRTRPAPAVAPPPARLERGGLRLDPDAWEATCAGKPVPTTATEFRLLMLLAAAPSRFHTRDAIIEGLHGPGFAVTDRTVDSHVRNLRAKFAAAGCPDVVETRAGVGYRLGTCR